jgi:hypothetical protein
MDFYVKAIQVSLGKLGSQAILHSDFLGDFFTIADPLNRPDAILILDGAEAKI